MHLGEIAAFAGAMISWTAVPGPGFAAVLSRTLAAGPRAGFAVMAGLALADALYLIVAVAGLVAIAETNGALLLILNYAAVTYFIWQGIRLLSSGRPTLCGA